MTLRIPVKVLDKGLSLPRYAAADDAGLDLLSAVDLTLAPGERALVPTGIAVAIPEGYAGFVHAKSGRAIKEGLSLVNAPGLIDAGYRGEVQVVAVNLDPVVPLEIRRGEKVAQLVVQSVAQVELVEVQELPVSDRGAGGFGGTGL